MPDWFKRIFQTRYVGWLEGEVQRLRAENRALTNSLLGTAGFPPVDFPQAPATHALPRLRKRSWHQIQAWRESDAAREAASQFPGEVETRPNGPIPQS
ncbi:MAG TPA: hypothetical protein VLV88_13175 [Terriglobales bacterium]|nr:hypothetical protein [Terriglobales bacterium]